MIEITNSNGSIIAFDGRVIEVFISRESQRFHVKHIKSIEAKQNKKGIVEITGLTGSSSFCVGYFDPSQKAVVDELVSKVRAAMG